MQREFDKGHKSRERFNLAILFSILIFAFSIPATADAFTLSKSQNNLLGLVGWWTFDGKDMPSGKATDLSGNGNSGSPVNISTSTFYSAGKIGQAGNFDAVNDRVVVGDPADEDLDFGTGDFSIAFWVYRDRNVATNLRVLAKGATSDLAGEEGYAFFASNTQMTFIINASAARVSSPAAYTPERWTHVVGRVNRTTNIMSIYIDGVWVDDTTIVGSGSVSNSLNFTIGSTATAGVFWDGKVDDVRVYNRALSASEIRQLYNSGTGKVNVTPKDPLKSGLVGHWTFDGKDMTNGVALDRSGSFATGSPKNIATSTFYTGGKIGQALNFDGVNDYVSISDNANVDFGANQDFTVAAWVKTDQKAVISKWPHIISKYNTLDATAGYNLILHNSDTSNWYFTVAVDGSSTYNFTGRDIADGTWHFIVGIRSGSNLITYQDGAYIKTTAGSSGDLQNTIPLDLGRPSNRDLAGYYLDGSLDDVRIYNRALSATEIKQLYNQGAGTKQNVTINPLTQGLVGHWTFDGKDMVNGVAIDRGGSFATGSPVSIATSTFYTSGKFGQALNFDGVNDYVKLADSSIFDPGGAYSSCGWFFVTKNVTADAVLSQTDSASQATYKWIAGYITSASRSMSSYVRIGGVVYSASVTVGADGVLNNEWHHYCSTFDRTLSSGRLKIYVDGGAYIGQADAVDGDIDSGDFPAIARWGSGGLFDGKIDDVRLYNRALSASEVKQLYNLGR